MILILLAVAASLAFDHSFPEKKTVKGTPAAAVDVVADNDVAIAAPAAKEAAPTDVNVNSAKTSRTGVELAPLVAPVTLEHSVDGGASFRVLASVKSATDIAWNSAKNNNNEEATSFDIATLRRAANASYVVRLQARPEARSSGVRVCEWWHDVRKSVVTVHVDAASGAAYHVDVHVPRGASDASPLSCADAALLPAASALRQPAVRLDYGRVERPPRVTEFRRAVAKQRAQADDQRPWYIKYWYYIVPAVVIFLISSMTSSGGQQ